MRSPVCLAALSSLVLGAWGRIQYLGVAIPGIDFGCDIDGGCPNPPESIPLLAFGGGDGEGQMQHFVENDKLNMFRLPVTWQFILNGKVGSKLDDDNFAAYDKLMKACLDTGAHCMIDLHNFARYDDGIIGQGGPTDDEFADLWSQIATKYASKDKVVFGLMNEPHDLDMKLWADSCQAAVTVIRNAGAGKQMILLPGTNFTNAETFVSTGSAELLAAVENPDGTKDGLLLDLHKYLDINNSGTHSECTSDNVEAFKTIATWLRKNKRTAMISETGASMDPTCMVDFCKQNQFIAANTDVFIGFVGWGAGSFDESYILSLTPLGEVGSYTDNKLMKQCILEPFDNETPVDSTSSPPSPSTQPATRSHTATSTSEGAVSESSSAPSHPPETSAEDNEENGSADLRSSILGIQMVITAIVALRGCL